MKRQGEAHKVIYNARALLTELKCCSQRRDIEWGRRIHARAVESRNGSNIYVVTALIRMFSKCGSMIEARRVFDSIRKPDVVSWTALLLGYADNGEGHVALSLFFRMKSLGCASDSVTYVAALKACTSLAANGFGGDGLVRGREIHSEIGCHLNHYVKNTLIDMYGKCGSMIEARQVFDSVQKPDVVSWNALLSGYAENGNGLDALEMFSRMKARGFAPDSVTYVAALKACTTLALSGGGSAKADFVERGKEIEQEIGCQLDHYLQNTLVDMYAKCGSMVDAVRVFEGIAKPDVVSWSALILGFAENGDGLAALDVFSRMKARGCAPNTVTYIAALKACTSLAVNGAKVNCLQHGRKIHSEIGFQMSRYLQNTLVDMYAKCGSMSDARRVFESIHDPDVVSWSALTLGYAENGDGISALDFLSRMEASGCAPDSVTYISAIKACGLTGDLSRGRKLHSEIREFSPRLVTCLVDFYAKCGSMVEARAVFDVHSRARDISTWNALLAGYSSFGDTALVFELFDAMQDAGFRPDAVTFVCLLLCCSHAGLVEKAREYLGAMPLQYGVDPGVMHYNCMIDVLGRANQLNEAVAMLRRMPFNPDVVTWMTLLGACRKWKNVEIGRLAFQSLVALGKEEASVYVLMAQVHEEQEMILDLETMMKSYGSSKSLLGARFPRDMDLVSRWSTGQWV